MPDFGGYDRVGESLDKISKAAVDYIHATAAERKRQQQFDSLKQFMSQKYNRPSSPGTAARPATPGTPDTPAGPGKLPIRGMAPTEAQPGTAPQAGTDVSPEVEMLRQMGIEGPKAFEFMQKEHTPSYSQYSGPRGERMQAQFDPSTNQEIPGSQQEIRPGEAPAPQLEYVPAESIGQRRVTRKDGNRINEKVYEIDKRTKKPTGQWKWQEVGTDTGANKESPKEKHAETYRKSYFEANQDVTNAETYYGKDRLSQWREELKKDPEAQNLMGLEGFDLQQALSSMVAQNAEKAGKAEKIKALKSYEKVLSKKQSSQKLLNGLGKQPNEDTGELDDFNPKAAKGKAAPASDKNARAKALLEKEGYKSDDEHIQTFLKNNPKF